MSLVSLINERVKARLTSDKTYRKTAYDALEIITEDEPILELATPSGSVDINFKDVFGQAWEGRPHTIEDEILIALAWQYILSGHIIWHALEVYGPPFPDKDIEKNDAVLKDMIRAYKSRLEITHASFSGGTQDSDGVIVFKGPFIPNGAMTSFPLEVGYSKPAQTYLRLLQNGCVARWAYGMKYILFLENKDLSFKKSMFDARPVLSEIEISGSD